MKVKLSSYKEKMLLQRNHGIADNTVVSHFSDLPKRVNVDNNEFSIRDILCSFDDFDNCTKYGNAKCDTNNCRCMDNYYDDGSTCQKKKGRGETCSSGIECLNQFSCTSGICQCATLQYWTGSTCVAKKSVNETCTANKECASTLNCSSGRCQCSTNQYWTVSACTALSGVPTSVTLSPKSRSIQISWSKPVESQTTIQGYRVRVLLNSECVVEVLLVCSTGCTNKLIQHVCSADTRQVRESRRSIELMEPISYEINQLLPYKDYIVLLNAINDAGDGNISETSVRTDSEVPQKPLNVSASVVSSNEVKVTWKLQGPKPGITTYHIKVYELVLNAEPAFVRGENVTGFDKQIAQFSGLEAYWNYTFTVVATTDKGSSKESYMSAVVTTYQDAPGKVTNFVIKRPSTISTTMEVSWSIPLLKDRNGVIKEYKINHNISGTTTTETIAAEYENFKKLYYIAPDRHYQIEIYAVNAINQAGEKLRKIYYASSAIEAQPQVSSKGYSIETVVGAAVGCVVFSGIVVGLESFCCISSAFTQKLSEEQLTALKINLNNLKIEQLDYLSKTIFECLMLTIDMPQKNEEHVDMSKVGLKDAIEFYLYDPPYEHEAPTPD
ncbi:unnamed protein product [Mytilus edulis]|uniref:Fibronectin type-III domain-containing protein n=1 Tax=Mytilus edulis TaxID=6550 RepID=A0A8S3QUD5_MYTED|nr:unnamed protein product [Mytilus edulis]